MFDLQIRIIEQIKVGSDANAWIIPNILPPASLLNRENYLTIQDLICTNFDEHLYEFLKKICFYPLPNHPELQFDRLICEQLKEKYQLDFLAPEYINHLYFTIDDLKRGDKDWRQKFERPHFFFTGSLLRAEFYKSEGYLDYRLLVCFKKPNIVITPEQGFLSSSIS